MLAVIGVPIFAAPANGPLRVHPDNPRYFTDGTKQSDGSLKAVYLTGSHTWSNLIDRGPSDPPPVFDFRAYLRFLREHNHNFIRLWSRHVTWYHRYGKGELHAAPLAWARTGPGEALDGKPKVDLTRFDPTYFDRLRKRVATAREQGIYVSIMLFGGSYECKGGWRGNPFHGANNINKIDGDPNADGAGLETQTLQLPELTRLQEAYVRKVVDTVNDLDNVLYEISNESDLSSTNWQHHFIRFIHDYEKTKPKQHPVGMTALYVESAAENNRLLLASPADWISPMTDARGVRDIPASTGAKVSIVDSDHWFVKELRNDPQFGREWVWESFCRGHNPILMEHLPPLSAVLDDLPFAPDDPGYVASRKAMGFTRRFAERMNLAKMAPRPELASSGFCLANPGAEYLVYHVNAAKPLSVELIAGTYDYEYFDPKEGEKGAPGQITSSGGAHRFTPPFAHDFVLYLKAH
jgi:hypothetical protein